MKFGVTNTTLAYIETIKLNATEYTSVWDTSVIHRYGIVLAALARRISPLNRASTGVVIINKIR